MKSEAEKLIDELENTFNLAGAGFAEFYKACKSASSGDYSKSASSGNSSQSASSGNFSQSASS